MPYVPPHKRAGGQSKPESMGGSGLKPVIRRAKDFTHTTFLVSDTSLLKFEQFQGESYLHLADHKLYAVVVAQEGASGSEDALSNAFSRSLALTERSLSSVVPKITSDLVASLQRLENSQLKPKMLFRFGKVLFCSHQDLEGRYLNPESLSMKKAFETGLHPDVFTKLQETVSTEEPVQVTEKSQYNFYVRDRSSSYNHLVKCVCELAEDQKSIVLKKVKADPFRRMLSDVVFVGKLADLRIMQYTQEHHDDLPEEKLSELKDIAAAAVIDEQVKGCLKWSIGEDSSKKHWSVDSVHARKVTILTGKTAQWKFTVANRSTRLTHELKLSPLHFQADQATSQFHSLLDLVEKYLKV